MPRALRPRFRTAAELDAWIYETIGIGGAHRCYRSEWLLVMARNQMGARRDQTRESVKRLLGTRLVARSTTTEGEPCFQIVTSRRGLAGTRLRPSHSGPAFGPRVNRGRWHGRPFRHGIFDTRDGEILAVWTDEDLQAVGYHHRRYMDPHHVEGLDERRVEHFHVDDAGRLVVHWPPW